MIGTLMALVRRRAARRRAAIVVAAQALGLDAVVEGEAVRLSGSGLMARWMRDLMLREAGRNER